QARLPPLFQPMFSVQASNVSPFALARMTGCLRLPIPGAAIVSSIERESGAMRAKETWPAFSVAAKSSPLASVMVELLIGQVVIGHWLTTSGLKLFPPSFDASKI